jgi:hypothetical protein
MFLKADANSRPGCSRRYGKFDHESSAIVSPRSLALAGTTLHTWNSYQPLSYTDEFDTRACTRVSERAYGFHPKFHAGAAKPCLTL